MVDFRTRLGKRQVQRQIDPLELYETLDRASDKGPLRPVQMQILQEWHLKRRAEQDIVVKLHTGQGKTLIGLLMLQSLLNEGAERALYLCPNRFLSKQTCDQAKQFGIDFCTAETILPDEFLNDQVILITHVQKLFNGQTKLKLGPRSIPVQAMVIDDAHACVDSISSACVIEIERENIAYEKLLTIFRGALEGQGAGTLEEIKRRVHGAILPVPYWSWHDRIVEVMDVLSSLCARPTDTQKEPHPGWFTWPLSTQTEHFSRRHEVGPKFFS